MICAADERGICRLRCSCIGCRILSPELYERDDDPDPPPDFDAAKALRDLGHEGRRGIAGQERRNR